MSTVQLTILILTAFCTLLSNGQTVRSKKAARLSRMPLYYGKRTFDTSSAERGEIPEHKEDLRSPASQVDFTPSDRIKESKTAGFRPELDNLDQYLQNDTSWGDISRSIIRSIWMEQLEKDKPDARNIQLSKRKYAMVQRMPGFYGKRSMLDSVENGDEAAAMEPLAKRGNRLRRMPAFYGKRSNKDITQSDNARYFILKRGVVSRMPAFYGKRSRDQSLKGYQSGAPAEDMPKRDKIDRMPAFYGKRGSVDRMPAFFGKRVYVLPQSLIPGNKVNNKISTTVSSDNSNEIKRGSLDRMPAFFGKRAYNRRGRLDRMPAFYGKRSQVESQKDDLLESDSIGVLKRGSLRRMPSFYGKREFKPSENDDDLLNSNNEIEKRGSVDRMPAFYGKRRFAFRAKKNTNSLGNRVETDGNTVGIPPSANEKGLNSFQNKGCKPRSEIGSSFWRLLGLLKFSFPDRGSGNNNENELNTGATKDMGTSSDGGGSSETNGYSHNQRSIPETNKGGTKFFSHKRISVSHKKVTTTKRRYSAVDRMPYNFGKRDDGDLAETGQVLSDPGTAQTQFQDQNLVDMDQPSDDLLDSVNRYSKDMFESSDTWPILSESDMAKYLEAPYRPTLQSHGPELTLQQNKNTQSTKVSPLLVLGKNQPDWHYTIQEGQFTPVVEEKGGSDNEYDSAGDAVILPTIFSEKSVMHPGTNGKEFGSLEPNMPFFHHDPLTVYAGGNKGHSEEADT